jgi:hypothetical protein
MQTTAAPSKKRKAKKLTKVEIAILAGGALVAFCMLCFGGLFLLNSMGVLQSATSTPTLTPSPIPTLTFTLTFTPLPSETPTAVLSTATISPTCDCAADTLNCENFNTQAQAQTCMDYCISQGAGDIHGFDRDANGLACEDLP